MMNYSCIMKILHEYQNGNTNVKIYEDGTKIREWPDGEPSIVEYPESCDLKITNWCDMNSICLYCFLPGQKVKTENGDKNIESIVEGERVFSFNGENKELKTVDKLFKRKIDEDIFVLEMDDGSVIKLTGNHRVYTQRGLIRADMLTEFDIIESFE